MKTFITVETETKTLTLAEKDISDILSACFMGNYWACIDNATTSWEIARVNLRKNGNAYPTIEEIMTWLLCNGGSIFVEDIENDYERDSFDIDDFLRGIETAIDEEYWDGEDVGDIDGEIGDVILQLTLFGEVLYG